jgi:hypothetical protein
MSITKQAITALGKYLDRADKGHIGKDTIYQAVVLTASQQNQITAYLRKLWNNSTYNCPPVLDIKPKHGYESRVLKDGFASPIYLEWLILGCSDAAIVDTDDRERPRLKSGLMLDFVGENYHLLVPVRSDVRGVVYVDDVIPKGLPSGSTKK